MNRTLTSTGPTRTIGNWILLQRGQRATADPGFKGHIAAAFLIPVLLFGGSARGDIASVMALRPWALVALGYGLLTLSPQQARPVRLLLALAAGLVLLHALQLVPLPPPLWEQMPGRRAVADITHAAGLAGLWRPLSLTPAATWNSLWSCAVPAATLVLAAQLPARDHRVLGLLLGAGLLSAGLGFAQVLADPQGPLFFYSVTNHGDAVGLFANRNHQAAFLACTVVALFCREQSELRAVRWRGQKSLVVQATTGTVALVLILAILLTGSRAGILFAVVATASWPFISQTPMIIPDSSPASQRPWRRRSWAAGAVLGLAGSALSVGGWVALERLRESGADEVRLQSFPVLVGMITRYLPLGSGMGSFERVFQIHEPRNMIAPNYLNHAHNDWAEFALDAGVGGLLILACAIVWIGSRARRIIASELPPSPARARGGLVIIIILALASLWDYPLRVPSLSALAVVALTWIAPAPTRSPHPDRSADDHGRPRRAVWGRTAIGAGSLGLALLAWRDAAVTYWLSSAPLSPPSFLASDPRFALASNRMTLLRAEDQPVDQIETIARGSRRAFAIEPLDAIAVRQLALARSWLGQDSDEAMLIMAQGLSRRETGTQIALFNIAAAKGDISAALNHLDLVLTQYPAISRQILPVLVPMLDQPRFVEAAARYGDRAWMPELMAYATVQLADPLPVAKLMDRAAAQDWQVIPPFVPGLVEKLLAAGHYGEALEIASAFADAPPARLERFGFTTETTRSEFAPLTWRLNLDQGVAVDNTGLIAELPQFASALLAERITRLRPGAYRLTLKMMPRESGGEIVLQWRLGCMKPGEPVSSVWNGTWDKSSRSKGGLIVVIPDQCDLQLWQLHAVTDDGQYGSGFGISDLLLTRVPSSRLLPASTEPPIRRSARQHRSASALGELPDRVLM